MRIPSLGWLILCFAATTSIAARDLSAQVAPLTPGETVLVTWRDPALGGTAIPVAVRRVEVVRTDDVQLVGRVDRRLYVIERRAISRVQRRIGTRPATAPEMVAGSAIGFAAGFLLGAWSAPDDRVDMGLSTGVLLGAPAGALVAWLASRSRGIYEDVPFGNVRPGLRVGRSAALGRVRFDLLGRVALP